MGSADQDFINQDKYNQANGINANNLDYTKLGWSPDPTGRYLVPPSAQGASSYSPNLFGLGQPQGGNSGTVSQLYQSILGKAPDAQGLQYWTDKMNGGMSANDLAGEFQKYATPGTSQYNATHATGTTPNTGVGTGSAMPSSAPTGSNGVPNYWQIAQDQQQNNYQNALRQSNLNNPNYYTPWGSQVRTMNPDGTYNVTQTLNPQLQQNLNTSLGLQGDAMSRYQSLLGNPLSYSNAPGMPSFNTSGVSAIPQVNDAARQQAQDAAYHQQTQYLDPQFQQEQSDLQSRLANQGIMPGSQAYDREMLNFNNAKQQAYGNAQDQAIQLGNDEQQRLFGMGLQANQTGMNNALAGFNTGLQSRQEGVGEENTIHNSQYNDLSSMLGGSQIQQPTYPGMIGTSIPGVDYLNAANMGYNATTGVNNANSASNSNMWNGLFGLGSALMQSNAGQNWLNSVL